MCLKIAHKGNRQTKTEEEEGKREKRERPEIDAYTKSKVKCEQARLNSAPKPSYSSERRDAEIGRNLFLTPFTSVGVLRSGAAVNLKPL